MSEIKAIETVHKGFRFRSRLEARWAVFFDNVGIRYDYEPEGFELGDGLRYLPDFFLPELDLWVEIKPGEVPDWRKLNPSDERTRPMLLASKLAEGSGKNVIILYGRPGYNGELDADYDQEKFYEGVLFAGAFDTLAKAAMWTVVYQLASLGGFLRGKGYPASDFDGTIETARQLIELDCRYYQREHGREHPNWRFGINEDGIRWVKDDSGHVVPLYNSQHTYRPGDEIIGALIAAQQARFEHSTQTSYIPRAPSGRPLVSVQHSSGDDLLSLAAELGYVYDGTPIARTQMEIQADGAPKRIVVRLPQSGDPLRDRRQLRRIHGIFTSYPGNDRFAVVVANNGSQFTAEFPDDTTCYCDELIKRLAASVGYGNIEGHEHLRREINVDDIPF
jgi:hypothetical protein